MDGFTGNLSAVYGCPLCDGIPPTPSLPETLPNRKPTLRIFVNIHNEVVLRCHVCGFAGTGLDLLAQRGGSWDEIIHTLEEHRVFGDEPIPEHWINRAKFWRRFLPFFERAQAEFRMGIRWGDWEARFGEVGRAMGGGISDYLPELGLPLRESGSAFLLEVRRSLLGLPLEVSAIDRYGAQIAHYQIHPPEPVTLVVPDWALFRDFTEEIILTTSLPLATQLQLAAAESKGTCPPIAWIFNATGPVLDDIPIRKIHFAHRPADSPDFALAFAHGTAQVTVSCPEDEGAERGSMRGKEVIEAMAQRIVAVRDQGVNPLAYMDSILDKPWIARETAYRLAQAVALRLGETAGELISHSGATGNLLPLERPEAIFLCRNGAYYRADDKKRERFVSCSNFSLSILESSVIQTEDGEEAVSHQLRLTQGKQSATFCISEEEFECGTRLLQRAVRAAVEEGFRSLPWMSDPSYIEVLPTLVKATQIPREAPPPAYELGWKNGAFYGPGFIATANGLRGFPYCPSPKSRLWLLPEKSDNLSDLNADYLRRKANELGTWLAGLPEREQRAAGVMLYAALYWLNRASRGPDCFLLAPSRQHLDFLGSLCGLGPIEVGRTQLHPWAPRLMASFYRKPEQFSRHGHLVAGIETPDYQFDPSLAVVVHGFHGEALPFPQPPSSYLSLLAYCCTGSGFPGEVIIKLAHLAESIKGRDVLKRVLEAGREYLVEPGDGNYLTCFLDAVRRHYGLERWLIESRRCERQGPLLRREVVEHLSFHHDYCFRETVLINELRKATGLEQPTRYGKDGIPAFALTEALVREDRTISPIPTASPPPHTQTPGPPDIEFLRTRFPTPRNPGAVTRGQLPASICITKLAD